MIQRLSENIVSWQIKKNILTGEQRALYQYAYEVMINQIVNILIALLIAVIMRAPMQVLIFLASYIPLRSYCGGYHARTNGGCTVVSAFLIYAVCLLEKIITGDFVLIFLPVCLIISGGLIFWLAPVPDKNKPLDEEETIRYRIKSRRIWLIESVIGMFLWCIRARAGVVIAISHILLSLMLIYGMLKNHRE
ncbi:accessory gene regulator B family protein [Clostridium sp. Marseille-P2415]|uniref:accessory gene regulator ArgB-like protein n=1 Tax=Clostridium sp. Marseille-P2415 TaxID=1805471 RepID=UPI0009887E56